MLDWSAHTAVVLASGPSLTAADCDLVRASGARTIAVNATFRMAPWADVVYMGDLMAIRTYDREVRAACAGQRWTCDSVAKQQYGWNQAVGLSRGGNSGHQAIHLAAKFGAKRIVLLGFDMQAGPDGKRHWHAEHPKPCVQRSIFPEWVLKMGVLAGELKASGVDVVNCSRVSALTCFPVGDLKDELCQSQS
jgi:hypothetical protein